MSAWNVRLDPTAIAPDRTELNLNSGAIRTGSIDWGDAEVTAAQTQEGDYGNSVAAIQLPNRTITIQLGLGMDDGAGGVTQEQARAKLQQKVGLLQREGGQVLRQRNGGPPMYADIVKVTLTPLDVTGETGHVELWTIVLETLPDFYGDEITLDSATGAGSVLAGVLTAGGAINLTLDPNFAYDAVAGGPNGWTFSGLATNQVQFFAVPEKRLRLITNSLASAAQATANINGTTIHGVSNAFACTAGDQVQLIANVLVNAITGSMTVYGQINWFNSSGTFLSASTTNQEPSTQAAELEGLFTAPAGAAAYTAQLTMISSHTSSTMDLWLENFLAVHNPPDGVAVEYFDGDSPGCFWLGVPGDSASQQGALIEGDYPARVRIIVADTSGHDQLGAIWGLRSRYHDTATTAALVYEAEALTPLNGAAITALTGASGGNVIKLTMPTSGVWVPMLATNLLAGTKLTHLGSYRVWARVYSTAATPQLRLLWGVGSLSVPATNEAITLPGASNFYLVDLGSVRLDAPAAGANAWIGAIQALGNAGDDVQIDRLYMQPLDEASGRLSSVSVPSASVISQTGAAGAGADNSGTGAVTWVNPGNITVSDGNDAQATVSSGSNSHYLVASDFGLVIPSGATINGIEVDILRRGSGGVVDTDVYIVKGGTIETSVNKAVAGAWPVSGPMTAYGASNDLWGQTWAPADINSSSFGVAIAATWTSPGNMFGTASALVDFIQITVYYTASTGLSIAEDAVVYADQIAEWRTEEMSRTQDGTVYGQTTVQIGDLPRLPPSGMEARPVELFVKPSRGDLDALPDAGLDGFTTQVIYRPCWLARP